MVWLLFAFSPLNESKMPGSEERTEKVPIFGDIRVLSRKTAWTILTKLGVGMEMGVPQNLMHAFLWNESLLETTAEKLIDENP